MTRLARLPGHGIQRGTGAGHVCPVEGSFELVEAPLHALGGVFQLDQGRVVAEPLALLVVAAAAAGGRYSS
jgi:hypothetical protein